MAKLNRVAALYAKSFIQGLQPKELTTVIEEMKLFSKWLGDNSEMQNALVSPMLSKEQREIILKDILAKANASTATVRVLVVLAEKKRLDALESIAQQLEDMKLTAEGIIPIYVTSGLALEASSRQALETKFESVLKKKVKANYAVESSLIAGVQVLAAGKTYEGSMAGWLSRLNEEFAGGIHS